MKMNDFDWLLKCVNVYSSSFRNVQERSQIDVVNVVRSIFYFNIRKTIYLNKRSKIIRKPIKTIEFLKF